MTIHASETEHHSTGGVRVCPIFPELRPFLESAWDAAPNGAVYVVERYRGNSVNLRTHFERLIKQAGLVPWPKLFQNLRASRETELMAVYPAKDVASWLGNSVPAATAHYAMATAESFQRAIVEGPRGVVEKVVPFVNPSLWVLNPYRAKIRNEKTLVSKGKTGLRWLGAAVVP